MSIQRVAAMAAAIAATFSSSNAAQTPPAPGASNTASSPDVNLTPRRVVFETGARGAKEVTVFNRSNATATYTVAVVDQVMTPEGGLVDPERAPAEQKAKLKSAAAWLRYSPRQVTLGPNESQTVRIQARKPADLPPGEYRAHFSVAAVPPQDAGLDVAAAAGAVANNELSIRLTPVYGIMIPVIVRNGDVSAAAGITDVRAMSQGGKRGIQFAITRSGDRSLYGGAEVFLLGSGAPRKIAQIRGIGVYNEVDRRIVTLPLAADAPALGSGAKVRVVFTDDDFKPGTVLAQTEVTLP